MPHSLNRAQVAELFHLAFLDVLSTRFDPSRFVLKGGANLRFFFDSVRYSEDIDIDLRGKPPLSLEQKVDAILDSAAIGSLLRLRGAAVTAHSKPKQTETTRRWKVGVAAPGHPEPIRTKIEFSGRGSDPRFRLEPIPGEIVAPYALRPPSIQHYGGEAAAEQKIGALANRSETQARDVFDLDLLLRLQPIPPGSLDPDLLSRAAELAISLPFDAFADQVLPFLDTEVAELYASEQSWERMQTFVAASLEAAR